MEISREQYKRLGKRGKYGNIKCSYKGFTYDSKAELAFAMHLDLLKANGKVLWYLRQVPIHLPADNSVKGVKYLADFMAYLPTGLVTFLDVKGKDTDTSRVKRSVASSVIGMPIVLVHRAKDGSFDWNPLEVL
jgi:hypothetical protein